MGEVKFVGRFRDLPPMGYEFQKLYARNYRVYHKGGVNDRVWIWQKGRVINFSGLSEQQSYLLTKMILEDTVPEYEFHESVGGGKYHRLTVDNEADGFCDHDNRHKMIYSWLDAQGILPTAEAIEKHEEAYYAYSKDWHSRYRDFIVPACYFDLIRDLHSKGMIEV